MTKTAVPASAIASAPVKAARDIGLDITRIFAFLCVVSVHFLIGSQFYDNRLTGEKMYVMTLIRSFSMVCVPLFLLLTGYLTCGRDVELTPRGYLKYTAKLRHVLLTYLFASLFVQLFCKVMTDVTMTFGTAMKNVLGFSQYGWYVEMYIGLFLLTPFLSLLLKNLDRRALTVFIAVLSVLTVAPSVFNVFNFFSSGNFISGGADKIIPQWWEKLYPVTYWFIGAYMRKYVEIKKLNTFRLFLLAVIFTVMFGVFGILKSRGGAFRGGTHCDWGSLQCTVLSVTVFLFVNSINFKTRGKRSAGFLKLVSELTFGAYIVSYAVDTAFYGSLHEMVAEIADRFSYYPAAVIIIASLSLFVSLIIYFAVKFIEWAADRITSMLRRKAAVKT